MMEFKVPFSGRAHNYTQDEVETVVSAMKNAVPLTQGIYLRKFEDALKKYLNVAHCFAVNNATAALEMAAQFCQFEEGDEVIIPSHTFTSSAYPFVKKGAKIIWADVDSQTHVVTAETIKACITPQSKAIVVAHLYGYVAQMPEIMKVASDHNLLVIVHLAQIIFFNSYKLLHILEHVIKSRITFKYFLSEKISNSITLY